MDYYIDIFNRRVLKKAREISLALTNQVNSVHNCPHLIRNAQLASIQVSSYEFNSDNYNILNSKTLILIIFKILKIILIYKINKHIL